MIFGKSVSRYDRYYLTFFISLEILVIIRNFIFPDATSYFWFCNFAPLLVALGFATGSVQFIKGVINIGLVMQWIGTADLISLVLFHHSFAGIATTVVALGAFNIFVFILNHVLSLNIALYATHSEKPKVPSLYYAGGILIFMWIGSMFLADPAINVNYVLRLGIAHITIPHYTALWPLLAFVIVVLPTFLIQNMISAYSHRKRKTTTRRVHSVTASDKKTAL